jgi:hypothetical protein
MAYTDEDKENDRVIRLVQKHLDKFTEIYGEDFNETNPMPENEKISVYCESNTDEGFVFNTTVSEMGLSALIAQKWILHSKLEELVGERILA